MAVLFTKAPDSAIVTGGTLAGPAGSPAIGNNTLSCWVNFTALSQQSELVEINDSVGGGFASLIEYDPAFGIVFMQRDSAGTGPSTISTIVPTPTIGTWYHLALTWDGTNMRGYVNGVLDSTTPGSLGSRGNWAFLQIGPAQAHIQDAHFFTAALSGDEILGLYKSRLSPRRNNLLVHSPLRTTGTYLLLDESGNGNSWSLSGTPAVSTVAPPQAGWGTNEQRTLNNSAADFATSSTINITADGLTQTTGAADVGRNVAITAAGLTQTSGAAALGAFYERPAAGLTQTTGAAAVGRFVAITATGLTQTNGAAALSVNYAQTAAGLTQTTGAADVGRSVAITAAGLTQTNGAADVAKSITANGLTQCTGAVDVALGYVITAAGLTQCNGAAITSVPLAAAGLTQTTGAATLAVNYAITAAGLTRTNGAAAAGSFAPADGAGLTRTAGAATVLTDYSQQAAGLTQTNGTAAVSITYAITASGLTIVNGFALVTGGIAPATGYGGQNFKRRGSRYGGARRGFR